MTKRIYDIAKELGIDSKRIVEKCRAEGISESVVKNHMSRVSVGLEASIREWFSTGGGTATAVEESAKIDIEQVKLRAPARRSRKAASAEGGDGVHTATTEAPEAPDVVTEGKPEAPVEAPVEAVEPVARAVEAEEVEAVPAGGVVEKEEAAPVAKATPTPKLVEAPAEAPAPMPEVKEEKPAERATVAAQAPETVKATPKPVEVAAERREPERGEGAGRDGGRDGGRDTGETRGDRREGGPRQGGSGRPAGAGVRPAPMNVPTRPTVVAPAGPKLEVRAPVRLSGPKVVRVEAPEVVDTPRPRRVGPGPGGPGAPGGPGRGPGRPETGGGEDDRGRSPRRRTGPGAGSPGQKRSSGQGVPQRRRATASPTEWVGSGHGISEQDLIEREERLIRAGGFLKKRRQDAKKPGQMVPGGPAEGVVKIAAPFTIKDLSAATGVKGADIVKKLFLQGVMATINSGIDPLKAQEIMIDFDIELVVVEAKTAEEAVSASFENREMKDERPRGPVVTILGHVDHGKTSLLDKIRNANVAAGEAGGITQRTSAFRVPLELEGETKEVVFLDTPGHEAFTSMRSRGANMTDVVVLVVSAPEGVMPQTIESINHAKAAKVPIVVALNKIDRPDATEPRIQQTLGQLAAAGLNPVKWGGETEVVETSAVTGQGVQQLLEVLDLQSQVLELKADFAGAAQGTVIESKTEEGRGAVANILVQQGNLKVGDFIVMGRGFGRVRDITDDRGRKQKEATPPMPVQVSGIDEVPDAGDKFFVVSTLKQAQEAAEQRRIRERQAQLAQPKVTLDALFSQMSEKDVKEILVVLKAAEQGTVDVLKGQCEKVVTPEVKVRVLHAAIGGITESDVLLAEASKAIVIGFNVIPSGKARSLADQKGVEIRTYEVIYDIVDDLKKAAEGLLAPEVRQEILGHAEVRKVFKVTKVGTIAGCYVTDGTIERNALIRVTRNGVVIENGRVLEQLKRFKDDAKDVRAGMECGMKIVGYDDIKEGDVLECYKQVEVKRKL